MSSPQPMRAQTHGHFFVWIITRVHDLTTTPQLIASRNFLTLCAAVGRRIRYEAGALMSSQMLKTHSSIPALTLRSDRHCGNMAFS